MAQDPSGEGRRWVLVAGGALALAAFGGAGLLARAQFGTVTVLAASSLTEAFRDMAPEWERHNPGMKLRFSFGASSQLRTQIEQGAPADVFASADAETMDALVKAGRVETPWTFAENTLILVTPSSNPGRINSLTDLGRPGLRLIATPETVPIGRYTQEALTKLGALKGFGPDFPARVNRNVVSREANVRALLTKVEIGEADAAFVYASDARSSTRARAIPLPDAATVVADYPIAVVDGARNRRGADAFVRYVLSGQAQSVLRRHGFR